MPKNFFGEDDDETGITNEGPRNFFFFFFLSRGTTTKRR